MKNKVAPFKRVLAFCLSLVLALTPVLTGAVSAADGDDATPAIVNPPSFIYDKDGNYLPDATEIPEGGVRLTKTAKPVDGDPYSFDITLEVEAPRHHRPGAERQHRSGAGRILFHGRGFQRPRLRQGGAYSLA